MGERWVSADSRRLVSASEQDQVQRFTAVVHELESLSLRLAAVLHVMRECQAGQPQAARSHREGDDDGRSPLGQLWCWEHERSLAVCIERDGLLCTGELGRDISDPVGNAAILADRATRDREMLLRRLEELTSKGMQVLGLAANYPTSSAELDNPEPDDEVGTVWCRSCWKDNKACEPVYLRPGADKPLYAGLCLWCGRHRAAIGGAKLPATDQRGDPPTWMVEKHRRGDRVTKGDIDRAAKSVPRPKGKKRR
jgi:hypothetical protein